MLNRRDAFLGIPGSIADEETVVVFVCEIIVPRNCLYTATAAATHRRYAKTAAAAAADGASRGKQQQQQQ